MFFPQQHGCPKNRNSRFSSLLFHFLSIQTSKNIYKTMIKLRYPQQKFKAEPKLKPNLRERIETPIATKLPPTSIATCVNPQ